MCLGRIEAVRGASSFAGAGHKRFSGTKTPPPHEGVGGEVFFGGERRGVRRRRTRLRRAVANRRVNAGPPFCKARAISLCYLWQRLVRGACIRSPCGFLCKGLWGHSEAEALRRALRGVSQGPGPGEFLSVCLKNFSGGPRSVGRYAVSPGGFPGLVPAEMCFISCGDARKSLASRGGT